VTPSAGSTASTLSRTAARRTANQTDTTDTTIQISIGSKANVGDVLAMSAVVLIDDQSGDWENNAVAGTANAYFQPRRAAAGTGITPSFDRTPA